MHFTLQVTQPKLISLTVLCIEEHECFAQCNCVIVLQCRTIQRTSSSRGSKNLTRKIKAAIRPTAKIVPIVRRINFLLTQLCVLSVNSGGTSTTTGSMLPLSAPVPESDGLCSPPSDEFVTCMIKEFYEHKHILKGLCSETKMHLKDWWIQLDC